MLALTLGGHEPRIARQFGQTPKNALDRSLRLRIDVDRVNVHPLARVRDPEHDVIAAQELRHGRLDRQSPIVATPICQRRQDG
jgi:hypothetical protein